MNLGFSTDGLVDKFKTFSRLFTEHSRIIYFVLFLSVIIGAISSLNVVLYEPSDEAYRAEKLNETQSARFDTATIKKIQQLNAQQQTNTDEPPAGSRSNPFGE